MNVWFRRARVVTMADLFLERFNSRALAQFYALFQVGVTVIAIGFGCFTAFTIGTALITKPEAEWTEANRASAEGYREWRSLEKQNRAGALSAGALARLEVLRDLRAAGSIDAHVSSLKDGMAKVVFYLCFVGIVATYMVLGGMTGAAFNEAVQGVLIIAFSVILLPAGLHAIGGWSALGQKVPREMFNLFGTEGTGQFTGWTIFAITLASLVQVNALSSNTSIMGSARTELAARVGVVGFYGKRVMIILWTFTGLIAVALFSGERTLPFPDAVWGMMSRELLGPGLMGLMIVGVAAGVMSNLAAKAMSTASLFVQNFCHSIRPDLDEKTGVRIARWTIVAVFALGVLSASLMSGMEAVMRLVIIVNVPFGAVIFLMLFWRRLTVAAVWIALISSMVLNLVIPMVAVGLPAVRENPALLQMADEGNGRKVPVYFDAVTHAVPGDLSSRLEGRGRFNLEAYLVGRMGGDVARFGFNARMSLQYLWDVFFPFMVLIVVSLMTRKSQGDHVALFYGKMKTPVGDTPELEHTAMEATRKAPERFEHLKLFGCGSSWEFTRWDRVDTVGFAVCCALSAGLIGLFCLLLRLASG
jgi:Na+/proline symporter